MKLIYDDKVGQLDAVLLVHGDKVIPVCNYKIQFDDGICTTTISRWGNKKQRKEREVLFQKALKERNKKTEITNSCSEVQE